MDPVKKLALRHIRAGIRSEELRKKVTPDYLPGCKRLLIANDYYPALERRNVELVTERIAEVRARSVVTEDGRERPADALIFATGFRPTDLLTPLRILGRGGVDLNDAWRDGLEAHYGITVSGFPNLFLLVGPNTGLGHNSILFMIEAQVRYVMSCLNLMRERGAAALEVLPEAQARFNRELQERMKKTVWMSGCKSWYQDSRGKNTTLWPGFTWEYWLKTRRVRESEYRLSS
jgi:cation diffusion facilitator CzcD-associated flavoprotein CzcO